jgi:signal transduction histidine kinase
LVEELIADLQSNATRIHEHGQRADRIVRAMLEHSRDKPGEPRPTNLNALVDQYVTLTYKGWRASDLAFSIDIERDLDPAVGMVEVAPQELSRVVLNLVNNACDALRERWKVGSADGRPTLWVSSWRDGDRVEIRVRDNGTGIPEARLEQVFQPFFTTKPAGSGTGLGLSISYDIVTRQHGGRLRVESVEGQGTEFVIELPARPALALEDAER